MNLLLLTLLGITGFPAEAVEPPRPAKRHTIERTSVEGVEPFTARCTDCLAEGLGPNTAEDYCDGPGTARHVRTEADYGRELTLARRRLIRTIERLHEPPPPPKPPRTELDRAYMRPSPRTPPPKPPPEPWQLRWREETAKAKENDKRQKARRKAAEKARRKNR